MAKRKIEIVLCFDKGQSKDGSIGLTIAKEMSFDKVSSWKKKKNVCLKRSKAEPY